MVSGRIAAKVIQAATTALLALAFFGSDWFFNHYMEWNLERRVATTFGDALGMQEMGQICHINQISSNKDN